MSDTSFSFSNAPFLIALTFALGAVVLYVALSSEAEDTSTDPSVSDTVNVLTEDEREAGWKRLFDGSTLDDWRGYQQDQVPSGWTVDEGAIHFQGEGHEGGTLLTAERYDHFELRIEWKISSEGNSGIMYRVTEEDDVPYKSGPEFQVLDNAAVDDPVHQAGALYGLYPTQTDATNPVGEFNESRILVRGSHVEHWMNGTKLLEAEMGSDQWNQRVSETKFADYPHFAEAEAGYIALQDHGDPVWFRDIKLRPLDVES